MRAITFVTAVAGLCLSFVPAAAVDESRALDDYAAQQARCMSTFPAHTRHALAEMLRCSDDGISRLFHAVDSPSVDIIDMAIGRRSDIATRLDRKQLTWAQAQDELDLLAAQVLDETNRRIAEIQSQQAQQQDQAFRAEREREARICYANGLLAPGMTAGAAMGYAGHAYIECLNGRPMPPLAQSRTLTTHCSRELDGSVNCTTQ
jgi:hypothetical protein